MNDGLLVIETGEFSERWHLAPKREDWPQYLGMSPTIFPHWNMQGRMILPLAHSKDVIGPQKSLDALNDGAYGPIRKHCYVLELQK